MDAPPRVGRALVAAVAALLTAVALVPAGMTAARAAVDTGLDIDHVETSADGIVSVLVGLDVASSDTGGGVDPGSVRVEVDGAPVEATAEVVGAGQLDRTTILALDTSLSMRGARIQAATEAARAFLDAAPADVRIGLVTFAGKVRTLAEPTTDHQLVADLVDELELTGGTRVHEAVLAATELAGADGARQVIVLSDGQDQGSTIPLEAARGAAVAAGVVVDIVALDRRTSAPDQLATVARATGGEVVDAGAGSLAEAFEDQADALAGQVLIRFPRPDGAEEEVQLEVSAMSAGRTLQDSALVALPAAAAPPSAAAVEKPLVGWTGMLIGAAGIGLGLALLLGVVLLGRRGPTSAQRRLTTYLGEDTAAAHGTAGVRASAMGLAEAVVTEERGERLLRRLQGAGMAIAPAEWVLLHIGAAVLPALVGLVLGGPVLMVLLLAAGVVLPWVYLRHRHARRLHAFGGQLPETLTLMAGGLSAGLSLPQAVDTVVRENQEPMAGELRRALVEQRLGIDVEDALEAVADRMGSEDFSWVVMAVRIQREVGGNLSEILNTVADTLREREYLRRQVRSLSAEGRLSGWILGGLPPLMFLYMLVTNRDYVDFFWTEGTGVVMLTAAVLTLGLGAWFMSRLVKVQV